MIGKLFMEIKLLENKIIKLAVFNQIFNLIIRRKNNVNNYIFMNYVFKLEFIHLYII